MQNKYRVLHVIPDFGIGGISKVVVDICNNLDETLFETAVYSIRKYEKEMMHLLQKPNVEVFHYADEIDNRPKYDNIFKLTKLLRKMKFDIIHTHNTPAFIDGMIAGLLARTRVKIHTDHARLYPDKKRYILAERILSRIADKVVAVSAHTKEDLITYQQIDPNKIAVIPNGIDLSPAKIDKNEKKLSLGIEGLSPIIGLGVRLSEQKGITYLLQAMPSVIKMFPQTVLLIAGGGPLEQPLVNEAIHLGIEKSVRFLGFRMDIAEILSVLDVYVLPSLWEGLPLVVLEAMAVGCPVVATSVGGTSTAVLNGKTGLLVPAKDPSALADAILNILHDSEKARSFGAEGYQRYRNSFTVDGMVSKYQSLYLDCLFNGRGSI